MESISLSPSKLGVLKECDRCFFDANVLKIERPRGIFPSLPNGVDRVMKDWMDADRSTIIEPLRAELSGKKLWGTIAQITKLRNWRSGLKCTLPIAGTQVSLIGALDDLLVEPNEEFSPYDTKTKGSEPKDDGTQYYQQQMDLYALMLRENGMAPSGKAYLCYWWPASVNGAAMTWKHALYQVTADPSRAVELLRKAVAILGGVRPPSNADCEYCAFANRRALS